MKATITLEIEVKDNIVDLYPNFIFNYGDKRDFLINQVSSLNHNISLEEQKVYKNYHPNFDNQEYEMYDDGYKQTVTKVEIEPSTALLQSDSDKLYQIIVLNDNELELLLQNLTKEEMESKYIELCEKYYCTDAVTEFKDGWINNTIEMYDEYQVSDNYFDADDRANVIWEVMI